MKIRYILNIIIWLDDKDKKDKKEYLKKLLEEKRK